MKHSQRRLRKKPTSGPSLLERITPSAAGIDCGSAEHYVAVPADRDATPVRSFPTVTAELHRLADWLTACGVTTVAMESTGVYGSGNTAPDYVITGGTVQLRAERSGTGTGRVYTISASANDVAGNTVRATTTCTVPHDQR